MIKTLATANRSERVRFFIPRSVQQSIPIQRIFRDGIWQSNGKFTQTWRFADINYSLASHDDQVEMFRSYCAVLNSLQYLVPYCYSPFALRFATYYSPPLLISPSLSSMHSATRRTPRRKPRTKFSVAVMLLASC